MSKRKRQELDLKQRFEVMMFKRKNPLVSTGNIAEQFHCGKTQIQRILLSKDEVLKFMKLMLAPVSNG